MFYKNYFDVIIKKPIFIIGVPRSGTTVISEAISVHENLGWFSNHFEWIPYYPEISFLTRITSIPKIGHYFLGKKKQDSQFIGILRMMLPFCSEAYSVWTKCCGIKFERDYLINQAATESEKAKLLSTIKKILSIQHKDRFFAKLTGPPRINYLNSIFPDAIFIHILRDPRATVSSLLKIDFWRKGRGLENKWWQNGISQYNRKETKIKYQSHVALCATQWKEIIEVAWQEKKNICCKRYMEIRYEDFVDSPYETINKIFTKVNLPLSERVQGYINAIGMVKDMNYKYKKYLKTKDIQIIEKITSKTAQKAGYNI